jgi:hypothetical protein
MVGDGINDGPSLGGGGRGRRDGPSGSDIATNSAGVALMNDDLSRVPFLIELARRTRSIITQNIAASIVIALVGLALAATGLISETGKFALPLAGLYHFAGDIFVLANSFRLFRFGEGHRQDPPSRPDTRADRPRLAPPSCRVPSQEPAPPTQLALRSGMARPLTDRPQPRP